MKQNPRRMSREGERVNAPFPIDLELTEEGISSSPIPSGLTKFDMGRQISCEKFLPNLNRILIHQTLVKYGKKRKMLDEYNRTMKQTAQEL